MKRVKEKYDMLYDKLYQESIRYEYSGLSLEKCICCLSLLFAILLIFYIIIY